MPTRTVYMDTSALVAALVSSHDLHDRAKQFMLDAEGDTVELITAPHAMAECYSTLTSRIRPRPKPSAVRRVLQETLMGHIRFIVFGA